MDPFSLLESWLIREAGFWILTRRKERDFGVLLYEMPESVVAHNDFCDVESQVWVGVRQVADFKSKHKFPTRYLTVPTKALVSLEKLATAGMSVAIFESCLK